MRTTKSLILFLFVALFAFDSFAQANDDRSYVLQVATYGTWEEFAKDEEKFANYFMTLYAEETKNRIKVYMLAWNGEYQSGVFFSNNETDNITANYVKESFPQAFRRFDVKWENLVLAYDAIAEYKKQTPDEYVSKGGTLSPATTSTTDERPYVIQVATFGTWEAFAKEYAAFSPHGATLYVQEKKNMIKVFILRWDGERQSGGFYNPTSEYHQHQAASVFIDYDGAFKRWDIGWDDLEEGYTKLMAAKKKLDNPDQLASKGGTVAPTTTTGSGKYRVQLATFSEKKSNDHIADNYGFSASEKANADQYINDGFTRVKKKVCRVYYFGEYDTKKEALAKKKALEKNTKRKLIVVKK